MQCDDPQLHQDKYVAAVELCKKHFFAMSCAILDKAVIELEQLDIYETKMQDVIFMRARRVKRAAEESADNKEIKRSSSRSGCSRKHCAKRSKNMS